MEDEANATLRFKAWEEAYEARKEAKKAVKATPEFKAWEKAKKTYDKAKKTYDKAKKTNEETMEELNNGK